MKTKPVLQTKLKPATFVHQCHIFQHQLCLKKKVLELKAPSSLLSKQDLDAFQQRFHYSNNKYSLELVRCNKVNNNYLTNHRSN